MEKFAIGFGPKIYGKVVDGVEWQVNLLPLGGFVQLPQMSPAEGIEGKSEQDVPSIENRNRQKVEHRQIHIQDHTKIKH